MLVPECFRLPDGTDEFSEIGHGGNHLQRWGLENRAIPQHILSRKNADNRHRRSCGLGFVEWSGEWHDGVGDLYFGTRCRKP
jgi:hypothetical protein